VFSNNRAERELRTCVVGRKNHYGSRSVRGTEVAALFYTLLESAKLSEVDPAAYLRAATRAILADPNDVLLPHQFAALQRAEQPSAA
jgi:transposase